MKETVAKIFIKASTDPDFRKQFENPETRHTALKKWKFLQGLDDLEEQRLLSSTGTKLSDIAADFDFDNFYSRHED